jgi:hypothetical protein
MSKVQWVATGSATDPCCCVPCGFPAFSGNAKYKYLTQKVTTPAFELDYTNEQDCLDDIDNPCNTGDCMGIGIYQVSRAESEYTITYEAQIVDGQCVGVCVSASGTYAGVIGHMNVYESGIIIGEFLHTFSGCQITRNYSDCYYFGSTGSCEPESHNDVIDVAPIDVYNLSYDTVLSETQAQLGPQNECSSTILMTLSNEL